MKNKIVFASFRMTPPHLRNGGEITRWTLAIELQRKGYIVSFLGSHTPTHEKYMGQLNPFLDRLNFEGIQYTFNSKTEKLEYEFNKMKCILVPSENMVSTFCLDFSDNYILFTGFERANEIIEVASGKMKTVAIINTISERGQSALSGKKNPDFTLFNSNFTKNSCNLPEGNNKHVFYPVFDTANHKKKKNHGTYITFFNPVKEKGIELFRQIAERMPEERFLVVEGWFKQKLDFSLPNVDFVEFQKDTSVIYNSTKLLIVPSQWDETFGRVVVEAGLYGIPSVTSNRGGLSEALGNGGVAIEDNNVDNWVNAINEIIDNNVYETFCLRAKNSANRFLRCPIVELSNIGILK